MSLLRCLTLTVSYLQFPSVCCSYPRLVCHYCWFSVMLSFSEVVMALSMCQQVATSVSPSVSAHARLSLFQSLLITAHHYMRKSLTASTLNTQSIRFCVESHPSCPCFNHVHLTFFLSMFDPQSFFLFNLRSGVTIQITPVSVQICPFTCSLKELKALLLLFLISDYRLTLTFLDLEVEMFYLTAFYEYIRCGEFTSDYISISKVQGPFCPFLFMVNYSKTASLFTC